MALPSEDAAGAAWPLLRPRGSSARYGVSPLRTLALRFRGERRLGPHAPPPLHRQAGALRVGEVPGDDRGRTLMLSGDLDASSVPALEIALGQCSAGGADSITLDLSGLRFIDSAGLWVITSARRWCERRGHDFWLVPGPPAVQYVFEVTGLSDVLPFRVPGAPEQGAPRRSERAYRLLARTAVP